MHISQGKGCTAACADRWFISLISTDHLHSGLHCFRSEIKTLKAVPYSKSHFCPMFRLLFPFRCSLHSPHHFRNHHQAATQAGNAATGQKCARECSSLSGVLPFTLMSSITHLLGWCPTLPICLLTPLMLTYPIQHQENCSWESHVINEAHWNQPISSGQTFK